MKNVNMLFVIYTNKCNSKCSTCDYWKIAHDENKLNNDEIFDVIKDLYKNDLETVIFSGGEALVEAEELFDLCKRIKLELPKLKLRILTNGILLKKFKEKIKKYFDVVVLSFDAANEAEYEKVRGIKGFNILVDGIKMLKKEKPEIEIRLRTLIHKNNFRNLNEIIIAGQETGANTISFLPVDIHSDIAFGGKGLDKEAKDELYLTEKELAEFEEILGNVLDNHKKLLSNGVMLENGENLKRVYWYYKNQLDKFELKCNTPLYSLTLDVSGNILPCFFIDSIGNIREKNVLDMLNSNEYIELKEKIIMGCKEECKNCIGVL